MNRSISHRMTPQTRQLLQPHLEHEITVCRAAPQAPHYGYYFCNTCQKNLKWIDRGTYNRERTIQFDENVMWFGKYQGMPIQELPQDYLEWLILNTTNQSEHRMRKLDQEYLRRTEQKV
jgi:hypothetical protein